MRTLARAEPAGPAGTRLGEGPRWDAASGCLLWVDIEGGDLHVFDPVSGRDRVLPCGAMVGAAAPWEDGSVLVALADALAACELATGRVRRFAAIEHPAPGMRCNDGACDPAGRFWVGTMRLDAAPGDGVLHRLDLDGRLHRVLTGLGMPNGIGWAPDGRRMFLVDSLEGRVDVFGYDAATGDLGDRRPFVEVPEADGVPDGLAVDDEGGVWVALHGGGEVRRFTAEGEIDGRVEVPAEHTTACAFGGPDGRRLFVTARSGLFVADVAVSGPPAPRFAGPPPSA